MRMSDADAFGPLPPGSIVGILGGGQLGRMLVSAAARLGLEAHIYTDRDDDPATRFTAAPVVGAYDDLDAVKAFARSVDVVTYEFENVPLAPAHAAASVGRLAPSARSLEVTQDRLTERAFLADLGIAVAPWRAVDTASDVAAGRAALNGPTILKARRLGYDGKGQARLKADAQRHECAAAFATIGQAPAILEARINFSTEVSVVLTRGASGEVVIYDVTENTHRDGILDVSRVPAQVTAEVAREAQETACRIADALAHVGTLAVEFFVLMGAEEATYGTRLLVNELAPRVHNSGHWTLDAAVTDQFENHIRAVCGWPLGSTTRVAEAEMANLIGADVDAWADLAAEHGARLHLYGKRDVRMGRKMGHVTRVRRT